MPGAAFAFGGADEAPETAEGFALAALGRPDLAHLSEDELHEALDPLLVGLTPEQVESFWGGLKKFGRTVAGVAGKALPGVIQGATTGMALGPWGALAGGLLGGVGGALGGGGGGRTRGRGGLPGFPGIPGLPGGLGGLGGAVAGALPGLAGAHGGRGSPLGSLLQLVQSPQLQHALFATLLGGGAARSIPVGPTQTPVAPTAILNLLGTLANRAMLGGPAAGEGEGHGDTLLPHESPDRLLALLESDDDFVAAPEDDEFLAGPDDAFEWFEGADLLEDEGWDS